MKTHGLPISSLLLCATCLPAQEPRLTVSDAVASALAQAPALKAAEAQAEAARARQTQTGWKRAGTFETGLLYTPRQKALQVEFPGIPGAIPPMSFEVRQLQKYALTGTYTLPLYTWGALSGAHRASEREAEAALSSAARSRAEAAHGAAQAFHHAAAAEAGIEVAETALHHQKDFLDVARARVKAGAAARLDELKADLALAKAESDLLEVRNRAALAREALAAATLDARFRTAALVQEDPAGLEPPSEEEALKRAMAARPDLEATRRQIQALEWGSRAARASGLPALAFRASLTQQHDDAGKVFRASSQLYTVGLALSWDALEPGRARARAAELEALGRALSQALRGQEEGVALEVRAALHRLAEARARLEVQARAVSVAEEQVRVARLAYREGAATVLEAQEAELALTAARFERLRARTDAALAKAALDLALGD